MHVCCALDVAHGSRDSVEQIQLFLAFAAKALVCKAVLAKIHGRPPAGTFANEQHLEFLSPGNSNIRASVDPKRLRVDSVRGKPWFGSPARLLLGPVK